MCWSISKNNANIIADNCVPTYSDYASDYVSPGFSYSESKEVIGPDVEYLGLDDDKIGPWSISSHDGQSEGVLTKLFQVGGDVR